MQHGLVGCNVLGLWLGAFGLQVRLNLHDFVPEPVEVDHQVFNHRHVTGGFYGDDTVYEHVFGLRLTGQSRVPIDSHGAGATD